MAIPFSGNDEFACRFKQPAARLSMQNVHYSVSHQSVRRSIRCLMNLRGVFGLNVQRLRRERKLSQEQLSFISGRTRAYISSVEAGRRNATLDTVEILAKALGVEPAALISAGPGHRRPARVMKQVASKSAE
ncbi:helix-turn-helix transcriptional regulator [Mesorhizobium sp. WSM4304]|uniref:helix-turn-helix domain-containing protein n=1 Tax=unclassified Mesorhizobium TaxID=325217 RepID=UPI0032AE96BF